MKENTTKQLVVGILAHVDAGKTTLSEGMLYLAGSVRKLGRVDHGDAFLDTDPMERERGITIFAKQARMTLGETMVTLLDTPGHVDFCAEMERTLQVLDYAILVISGADGIQAHTETLWKLLESHHIPTFLFINKMDQPTAGREALMAQLKSRLSGGCIDFSGQHGREDFAEQLAVCDEELLNSYLEEGMLECDKVARAIAGRKVFPCYFGSALKLEGVGEFLDGLEMFTGQPVYPEEFGAKVYKITRDAQGVRMTMVKVTGGSLKVRSLLTNRTGSAAGETPEERDAVWEEKVDQIRLYSGEKFQTAEEVPAGTVCALLGLSKTWPGMGLGRESDSPQPALEPVLTYRVILPDGVDQQLMYARLKVLEEEDPLLRLTWNAQLQEIQIQLMGEIQLEILRRQIADRFGVAVEFDTGNVVYRETIDGAVEGAGHYEPLRHYAEVHLLLEEAPRGSGLRMANVCDDEVLDYKWQRQILSILYSQTHAGVLTGAPITDMKITLLTGRAHLKHTEGGDFRQATLRALRQGLMKARSRLLEPCYQFTLRVPAENVSRALNDISKMKGSADPAEPDGEYSILRGTAPVYTMRQYASEVAAYTRGRGRLALAAGGYQLCHNPDEVIAAAGYHAESDLENPADSVFCSGGAGVLVPWQEADDHMHVVSGWHPPEEESAPKRVGRSAYSARADEEKELQQIFERTYGPVRDRYFFLPQKSVRAMEGAVKPVKGDFLAEIEPVQDFLLIDGYNIIHSWDELKDMTAAGLDLARQTLINMLANYQGFKKIGVILVFDAYRTDNRQLSVEQHNGIYVVYTRQAQTADAYIEKVTYSIGGKYRVRVATSDWAEQLIVLGHGALRMSARELREEIRQTQGEIAELIAKINNKKG